MFDIEKKLGIKDVDMRVLMIFTASILVNEMSSAYEMMVLILIGLSWAFATTPNFYDRHMDFILFFENKIEPITKTKSWRLFGQLFFYISIIMVITSFILI